MAASFDPGSFGHPAALRTSVPTPRTPGPPQPRRASTTATSRPVGTVTRGTTNTNRLRRMDRWIVHTLGSRLRAADRPPVAVDLGYGAAPWTAVELSHRLRTVRPDLRTVGIEIEPARVAAALPYAEPPVLTFRRGGFEVPLDGGPALLIRAANVLRQYEEEAVRGVWERLCGRLAPGGLLVEGTCDEIGRRHVWVALDPSGPRTVTFAARLAGLERPSDLAERLPKALIHHNVPGRPVHAFLSDFDRAWAAAAPYGAFGARQRWVAACTALSGQWPLVDARGRWRQGEVTLPWSALAP
ncbi:class I SAM-dependent methyltransferase [Kitasatospora sp. NBC_01266]|uniref:class I SAM-dependent methyltransferase n=1 Tax=Kitasatospora sp. NBC_01266 TaxID=2903572 RepID=UPI002E2EDB7C|nr:class I SAM-dependent methyltransferase [Kitasatospora sp. NBC_01266]